MKEISINKRRIERLKRKIRRDRSRFIKGKRIKDALLRTIETKRPFKVGGRLVWVLDHKLIRKQIVIRPQNLFFFSSKIPKRLYDIIMYHELSEQYFEKKGYGTFVAHTKAIEKELSYAKRKGNLKSLMSTLKILFPEAYRDRMKTLRNLEKKSEM